MVKIATFMKKKVSVSIEEKTIKKVSDIVGEGLFRNNSHLIELAVNRLLGELKSGFIEVKNKGVLN